MVVALTAASLAAHAAVVAGANLVIGTTALETAHKIQSATVEYKFSCWSDAGLAMSTRMLSCSVPGIAAGDCEAQTWEQYRFDLIICDGLQDELPELAEAVALMSPSEIDAIEPTRLLDVPEVEELEIAKLVEEEVQEKAEKAEERISNPRQAGQVIEVLDPKLEVTPDKARFLSEFDTKVEKETVARASTEEMVAAPSPKELPIAEDPEELPDDPTASGEPPEEDMLVATLEEGDKTEGAASEARESPVMAMRAEQFREEIKVGEKTGSELREANALAVAKGNGAVEQKARREREGQDQATGSSGARRSMPSLRPSEETLSRIVGGGSVDKLDGVESGDFTALTSKKWKFASFFNRMKRQVAQNWHPDVVYVRRDPTGKVYGTKNRVTVLEVSLKPNGSLAKVVVSKQSGVGFLDDEAVSAFHLAQPFPNPPSALVEARSQLITFSFGFHFQVGSRRDAWQIFRYN